MKNRNQLSRRYSLKISSVKIEDLINRDRNLVFLAGAGCSFNEPSCVALASEVMYEILNFICPQSETDEIPNILEKLRFEQLIEIFKRYLDNNLKVLDYYGKCNKPNIQHFFLAEMIKDGKCVLTTNFDSLIEQALLQYGLTKDHIIPVIKERDFKKYNNPYKLFKEKKYPIYKIHGSVKNIIRGKNTKDSLIATISKLGSNKEGLNIFQLESFKLPLFENLLDNITLVVLGYSGGDDFDIIPTLKNLNKIKEIIWINHIKNDKKEKIYEIINKMSSSNKPFDGLNEILIEIKENNPVIKIYRIDGNTTSIVKRFLNEIPKLSNDCFSLSFKKWLKDNLKAPNAFMKYIIFYSIYLDLQQLEDALRCMNSLLVFSEKLGNLYWKANALSNIGVICLHKGSNESEKFFLKAIQILTHLKKFRYLFIVYTNISNIFINKNKYQKALKYLKKAKKLSKHGLEEDKSYIFNNLGVVYKSFGNFNKARKWYKKALKIDDKTGNLKVKARHINNLGLVYKKQGKSNKAIVMYETSLRIVNKLFDLPAKAQYLNNLGAVYLEKCDYFNALKKFKKALEIDKKLGDPIGRSKRLNNIGIIYQRQGNYLLALQNYKISLKMDKKNGNKKGEAISLNSIGRIYLEKGIFKIALKKFNKALKIYNEIQNEFEKTTCYHYIGKIYFKQKKYNKSEKCFKKALNIAKKLNLLSPEGSIINSIGNLYYDQKKYPKALKRYKKAKKIGAKLQNPQIISISLNGIGNVNYLNKKYSEALQFFKKALKINRRINNTKGIAYSLYNIAKIFEINNNITKAFRRYKRAYRILINLGLCNDDITQDTKSKLENLDKKYIKEKILQDK